MAEKKKTESNEKIEREYVIPLRSKVRTVPRYKKTPKTVKSIKEFLVRHMKIRDRDLNKIKIDKHLNEMLWFRGIKNPPHKIKVKAIKEGEIVRVEAIGLIDRIKFRKAREDKVEKHAKEVLEKKKSMMQKAKESLKSQPKKEGEEKEGSLPGVPKDAELEGKEKKPTPEQAKKEEEKKTEKEKAKAVEEAGKKQAKSQAKQTKHSTPVQKTKTAPVRKALSR
jgi:large subunit ribosomal protein L31e